MPWYMKFGSIQGSVTAEGYTSWIHVHDASFGASRPAAFEAGKGAEARHKDLPEMSPLTITRDIDLASTAMMRNCIGSRATDCTLVYVEQGEGEKVEEVIKMELVASMLSDYSVSIGDQGGIESLEVHFTNITIEYNHHDDKGKTDKKRSTFDVLEAVPG